MPRLRPTRWIKRLAQAAIVVAVLAAFSLWLVTRSWFIVGRVTPLLSARLGGDVTIDGAVFQWPGVYDFSNLTLHVPGSSGPEGEVLRVGSMSVELDMRALIGGRVRVRDISVQDARLRLAEDADAPGQFNFMTLQPRLDPTATQIELPPTISVDRVTFETGHYFGSGNGPYELTGARSLSGRLSDTGGDGIDFQFSLHEVDRKGFVLPPEAGGIRLSGNWNASTNEHDLTIAGLTLDERAYNLCPRTQRIWWDRMGLAGRVQSIEYGWTRDESYVVRFSVEDVELRVPIGADAIWARYRDGAIESTDARPRMSVDDGTIVLTRERVQLLELQGQLMPARNVDDTGVGVPYRVTVDIRDIPPLVWNDREAWMQEVLDTVPFTMSFGTEEFRVVIGEGDKTPPVVLPLVVAQVLEKFRLSDWALTTSVVIERDAPHVDENGVATASRIRMRGTAQITDAEGAYQVFPYPLRDVSADLAFTSDLLMVRSLAGSGPSGARIELTGTITPPGPNPEVYLELTATDVPVDEHLRSALSEGQAGIYDDLFHAPSLQHLRDSELLSDDDPFELGGTIDLELGIARAEGEDEPTRIEGAIHVHELGLLYRGFPYPIAVESGTIRWTDEALVVDDTDGGLTFRTYGGGEGRLLGSIEMQRDGGERRVVPHLEVRLAHDRMNDTLYAAVPGGGRVGEEEARGAELLRSMDLKGILDCHATIGAAEDGGLDYELDVALRAGSAQPVQVIDRFVGDDAQLDADDWALSGLHGRLRVTPDAVEIIEIGAAHAHGRIRTQGTIDLSQGKPGVDVQLVLEDTELGDYLVELLPRTGSGRVHELWSRFRPTGLFDAQVDFIQLPGEPSGETRVALVPRSIQFTMDERPVSIEHRGGAVTITKDRIALDGLEVALKEGDDDGGIVHLDGSYGLANEEGLEIIGTWNGARLQSAAIPEALALARRPAELERWRATEPFGVFDGRFEYHSAHDEAARDYAVELRPRPGMISLSLRGTRLSLDLQDGALVRTIPGRTELTDFIGRHPAGTLRAAGTIESEGERLIADLAIAYEGRMRNEAVEAVLPEPVVKFFDAIELTEGGPSRLEDGRLLVRRDEDGLAVDFQARAHVVGGSCRTGVLFEEVVGSVDIVVNREPGGIAAFDVHGVFDEARVLGQELSGVEVEVVRDERHVARIARFSALARTGSFTADGEVGFGERNDYRIHLRAAGVPLEDFVFEKDDEEEEKEEETRAPSDGAVYACLDLSGVRGDLEARVGRGSIRVNGDRLAAVPFGLQIFQVLQLSLPGSHWNFGDADFYLHGSRLVFERMLFEATFGTDFAQQQLFGAGVLDLDSLEFLARFQSRGSLPIVRDILGSLGDRLAAIEVAGPLRDLKSRLVPLPAESDPASWLESVGPRVLAGDPTDASDSIAAVDQE